MLPYVAYDEDGYQPVGRDPRTQWWRSQPDNAWQVLAVGLLAFAVYVGMYLLFGSSATRAFVTGAIFAVFFTAISAYQLWRRRRH
jgi:hypothetical protein